MPTPYQLYARKGSGSFAVEVAFEEIGVPYDRIWINKETEQLARLWEVNPAGKIPVLVLPDGTAMVESAAILMHLSNVHPEANLAPVPGTSLHARFLQWMVFLSANVYEAVLRIYYSDRFSQRGAADAEAIRQRALEDYLKHLAMLEPHLTPGVLGGTQSIADVYLYMLASWYPADKAELYARLPRLGALCASVSSRSAVRKIDAEHAD
jgi:glutathione S-transferase